MSNQSRQLTAAEVRALLHYDPNTGVFAWRMPKPACRFAPAREAGAVAGGLDRTTGYMQLQLLGKRRLCHRLAWLYMTGKEPEHEVDHINGTRSDNRWVNLRDVPKSTNTQNQRAARADSASRLQGVQFCKKTGKFRSRITVNKQVVRLGYFSSAAEAHADYLAAKRQHHAGCTI